MNKKFIFFSFDRETVKVRLKFRGDPKSDGSEHDFGSVTIV